MAIKNISYKKILNAMKIASNSASIIIKKALKKKINSKKKSYNEWVTETDLKSEKIIISYLKKYYPESGFIAEESGILKSDDDSIQWIIDPIDGTNNFITKYPHFCISIAAYYKNELICGTIENPTNDEFFHAIKGKGAYLNNIKINVTQQNKIQNSVLGTGFVMSNKSSVIKSLRKLKQIIFQTRSFRRSGSAALDLAYVASGRLDGYWQYNLKPWDYAAGVLLVSEAGGKVSQFDGKNIHLKSSSVLATNSKIHNQVLKILK